MAFLNIRTALGVPWLVAACGVGNTSHSSRPAPIAYADTLPIDEPRFRESRESSHLLDAAIVDQTVSLFTLRRWMGPDQEAANITHFDDVVNSAWFEHRNGFRRLTPEEVARGPTTRGPDATGVFTIVDVETEGRNPGFIVRDIRGERFVFKFDPLGFLHLASAAEVISSRLFYAAGYNTSENYIVVFEGAQLVLDPAAQIPNPLGGGQWMQPPDLVRLLSSVDRLPNGRFLAMARKILPGVPKGPFHFEGRRSDDPNDYYYHEYRRELRGLSVLTAWLNHASLRFTDTQDSYVGGSYLRHYLVDFGETLGSGALRPQGPRPGRQGFGFAPTIGRFFSLGFYGLPVDREARRFLHPSIGRLPAEEYRPDEWKQKWPNAAFSRSTSRDGYWAAKLIASFTDEQIGAAVVAGGFSDLDAAGTLARIIALRRDRTVAYWYSQVTPIENVTVIQRVRSAMRLEVSFDDLGIRDGVWQGATAAYRWEFEHKFAGIHWRGESREAAASARQTIIVESDGKTAERRDWPSRLVAEKSVATLMVTALRGEAEVRSARILMAWDGNRKTYKVVGLEH